MDAGSSEGAVFSADQTSVLWLGPPSSRWRADFMAETYGARVVAAQINGEAALAVVRGPAGSVTWDDSREPGWRLEVA